MDSAATIKRPKGNVEFLVWLGTGGGATVALDKAIEDALAEQDEPATKA